MKYSASPRLCVKYIRVGNAEAQRTGAGGQEMESAGKTLRDESEPTCERGCAAMAQKSRIRSPELVWAGKYDEKGELKAR